MLFRNDILGRIANGDVTLAFRCWRRPTVQVGTRLHTPVGMLHIRAIAVIDPLQITDREAKQAGASDAEAVRQALAKESWRGGSIYRIAFTHAGADPRIALRERGTLSPAQHQKLRERLDRLDQRGADGPWVTELMQTIRTAPGTPARDLAATLGWEVDLLKRRVRVLKNLGLTESLQPGYRLSPRGVACMRRATGC